LELYGSLRLAIRQTYPEFCKCFPSKKTKNEEQERKTKLKREPKSKTQTNNEKQERKTKNENENENRKWQELINSLPVESKIPEKGWGNIEYRRKYFCKLAEELKFDPFVPENWQKVTRAQVRTRPVRHPLHSPSTTPLSPPPLPLGFV